MKIAYAKQFSNKIRLKDQINELVNYRYENLFLDSYSFNKSLNNIKSVLNENDTLIIVRFDIIFNRTKHILSLIKFLKEKKINLISIKDNIDTTILDISNTLKLYDSIISREHKINMCRGINGSRPKKLSLSLRKETLDMYNSKKYTIKQICEKLSISAPTVYKYINEIEILNKNQMNVTSAAY